MTNIQTYPPPQTTAARRTALGLLAAVAVTLACVVAPLAGTAYAGGNGGVNGDPPESRPPTTKPKMVIGDPAPTFGSDTAGSTNRAGNDSGDIRAAGSKPGGTTDGVAVQSAPGEGTIDTLSSKLGTSSGSGL